VRKLLVRAGSTIRHARMPETRKRALKAALLRDMAHVRALAPDLSIVKVADGVDDNGNFLRNAPGDVEVIDLFHACERFSDALATGWGGRGERADYFRWVGLCVQLRRRESNTARRDALVHGWWTSAPDAAGGRAIIRPAGS
jgi:hypothetical protein